MIESGFRESVGPDQYLRVMAFVDGSNILRAAQRFREGTRIDYVKLVGALVGNRQLIRPYFFGSYNPTDKDRAVKFYDALRARGFEVIVRPVREREREGKQYRVEKGVDVALTTKLLSHAFRNTFDVTILVSGDADYLEAIQVVKDLGKRVEIATFKNSASPELFRTADRFIALDELVNEITLE